MSKPVLFSSCRPLHRAENLRAAFDAYDGQKTFVCTHDDYYRQEVTSGRYDLMVIDEFPTVTPGKCIMIWHGMQGCKTIGLDQPAPYYRISNAVMMSRIIAAGHGAVPLFSRCTGLPERKILPLGFPRTDDYICRKKGDGHTPLAFKRSYLYAPTFRLDRETPLPDLDWDFIDNELSDDELFVVKGHPYRYVANDPHQYRHIVWIPADIPSAPFLYDCDVVVTDYSSIILDAYLLRKPSVLLEKTPGYTDTRGMYLQYPQQYSSRFATSEHDLITLLRSADSLGDVEHRLVRSLADMCDGHACERLVNLINSMNFESKLL